MELSKHLGTRGGPKSESLKFQYCHFVVRLTENPDKRSSTHKVASHVTRDHGDRSCPLNAKDEVVAN